jgi:hypothetical protein
MMPILGPRVIRIGSIAAVLGGAGKAPSSIPRLLGPTNQGDRPKSLLLANRAERDRQLSSLLAAPTGDHRRDAPWLVVWPVPT